MGLSSNSIVHFTKTKDALKGILSENFKVKYCREQFPAPVDDFAYYVPMVSFCDIPFSQLGRHIDSYGSYGIGLTREWAVRNRLNPVLYVQKGSNLAESYFNAAYFFITETPAEKISKERKAAEDELFEFFRYAKPYEGPLQRSNGEKLENYRFSDEREWRFVPPLDTDCVYMHTEKEFARADVKARSEKKLENIRLAFQPKDVRYIIIKDDSEIHEFVKYLDEANGGKYTKRDVELLTTRIVTSDQINTDF